MSMSAIGASTAASSNTTDVTSGTIDTTSATLLVVGVTNYSVLPATADLTDNGSGGNNTWTPLTQQHETTVGIYTRLFWCVPTKTGAAHSIKYSNASATYPCIYFVAFTGAAASPYDTESGNQSGALANNATIAPSASITPAATDNVFVVVLGNNYGNSGSAITVDAGFSTNQVTSSSSTNSIAHEASYLIQTTATAKQPTWTVHPTGIHDPTPGTVCIACFKGAPPAGPTVAQESPALVQTLSGGIWMGQQWG